MFYSQKKCIFANKFEAMMPSGPYRRQFPWRSSIETGLFWGLFPKKWHVSVSRSSPDFHTCYTHYGPYSFNIAEVDSRAGKTALPRRSDVADCNGKEKDYESGFHYYGASCLKHINK